MVYEQYLQNEYIRALFILVVVFVIIKIPLYFVKKAILKATSKTKTDIDDFIIKKINRPITWLVVLIGLKVAINQITLLSNYLVIGKVITTIIILIIFYTLVIVLDIIVDRGGKKFSAKTKTSLDESLLGLVKKFIALIGIIFALFYVLSFWGVEITPLLASLGIGGIAVALALQNVLGDIFASFSIYLDRPFKVGDFIIVGENLGVVKKIGIKTTRLESLWGEEVIISNRELTSTRISNYKQMRKRRIHFKFGITYETPTRKLRKIPQIVKEIFDKVDLADLNRVHFKEFGDFSLNFEVAYYVNTGDYDKYMDIQQKINFALKERFEKEGIGFAYPTQTIFVKK